MDISITAGVELAVEHRVSPQLVVHSALLELSAEELEECIVSAAESTPALKVVRRL
ncbi:MAG: hypothetical protein H5T86_15135, partial [Armatimonadetes bacterium]|nr:hypothetical protein [Armatimonadota bacterium]